MESLLRTRAGRFRLEDSLRLEDVEKYVKSGNLSQILLPLDSVFSDLRQVVLRDEAVSLGYNGNPLSRNHVIQQPDGTDYDDDHRKSGAEPGNGERFRVYDRSCRFIGIYHYEDRSRQFRIEKMFLDPDER